MYYSRYYFYPITLDDEQLKISVVYCTLLCLPAEKLVEEGRTFDAVLALEVFVKLPLSCFKLVPLILIFMGIFSDLYNEGHRACSQPCRVLQVLVSIDHTQRSHDTFYN